MSEENRTGLIKALLIVLLLLIYQIIFQHILYFLIMQEMLSALIRGIHDDGHIAIHPLIGHRFAQVFHRCLQLGMRATTGIQLLP